MARQPETMFSRFLSKVKITDDRLESPSLHQPQVKDTAPPRKVRPSRAFAYLTSNHDPKPGCR
jgi:hypothetical protein